MKLRSIAIAAILSLTAIQASGRPPVTKYRKDGGLFGYKDVIQTSDTRSIVLNCSEPGLIRCRVHGITVVGENDEISLDEPAIEAIEKSIDDKILGGTNSGVILYNSTVVVTYWFKLDSDELSYTLYSKSQAESHGIQI